LQGQPQGIFEDQRAVGVRVSGREGWISPRPAPP
jgi:hypothetical protein